MAIDTPATIVLLGAGPIGIEAAIYARYLGYDVVLLEQADLAENVRVWGHLRMFSPFQQNSSSLGLAALRAQDPDYQPPKPDQQLIGRQWAEQYLIPLSETDLLADHIRTHSQALAVERLEPANANLDPEQSSDENRPKQFQVLVQSQSAEPSIITADAVVDATGVLNHPMMCGPNGSPAEGEPAVSARLEYAFPDILGAQRARFARQHTLVIGNGLSAALTITALAQLAQNEPETRVHWIAGPTPEPIPWWLTISNSPSTFQTWRDVLLRAEQQAQDAGPTFVRDTERTLRAFDSDPTSDGVRVWFDEPSKPERYDRVVVNRGHRSDLSIYHKLQAGQDTGTSLSIGQMANPADRFESLQPDDAVAWTDTFLKLEPNLYIIGSKSFRHASSFPFSIGLQQIVGMFAEIGGRANLDLYATF